MKTISSTPEKITIRMKTQLSLANAIRRSTDEVLTLAIDEVEIYKNDSALYDEVLAHRLGLIPLKTDNKMSLKTKIDLKLSKTGPGMVYSKDLKGKSLIVHENIPITLLEKGQELEFVATAVLGKGTDHAKHSPGLCYYRHLLKVKSSNSKVEQLIKSSKCVIEPEKISGGWLCDLQDGVVQDIKTIDPQAISDSDEILFFVESWGQLPAATIIQKAISVLGENLTAFEKALA